MDDISTRTIIIAVNIFVTIAIVSLLIMMFAQMQDIYGTVATTDTSIYNKFDDLYSMYHGKQVSGIGLLNTIKKYEDQTEIENLKLVYPDSDKIKEYVQNNDKREVTYLKELMEKNKNHTPGGKHTFRYENKYNVTVEETLDSVTIKFDQVN